MKRFAPVSFLPKLGGRRASFKIGVVATLAIAVAANIAVLGNLGVLFGRVVPGAAHQNIVEPYLEALGIKNTSFAHLGVTRPIYDALAKRLQGRGVLALYEQSDTTLDGAPLYYLETTPTLADLFGIAPAEGRLLSKDDSAPNAAKVTVVSSRLAYRLFGGQNQAIGRYLTLDENRYRIVGVLPANFAFPLNKESDAWVALPPEPPAVQGSFNFDSRALLRPAPGVSRQLILSELTAAFHEALPGNDAQVRQSLNIIKPVPRVESLAQTLYGPVASRLELIEIAALLLVVLVLVNLSGLATADALARRHEYALRGVLGARPLRLYLERFSELATLALIGWALGIGLGWLGRRALAAILGQAGSAAALAPAVLGLTFLFVLVLSAVLSAFGMLHLRRPAALVSALGTGARTTGGRGLTRALRALIVLQLGVGIVLLVLATHLRANVLDLSSQNLGFTPAGRYFFSLSVPTSLGETPSMHQVDAEMKKVSGFNKQMLSHLSATPGVASAAVLTGALHWGAVSMMNASKQKSTPKGSEGIEKFAVVQNVSTDIVKAAGLTVLAGTPNAIFNPSSNSVFIDAALARKFWPNIKPENVIGRTIYISNSPLRIAAIVKPFRILPYQTAPGTAFMDFASSDVHVIASSFVIRSTLPPKLLRKEIQHIVRNVDPQANLEKFKSGGEMVADAYAERNHLAQVFGAVALVAVLIAAVGLFALLAYRSLVRRQEFAIRAALGATSTRLRLSVIKEAFVLWLLGVVIGIPAAYELARVLAASQPELGLPAVATIILVIVAMFVIVGAAAFIPAWRAARVNPVVNINAHA
ncbi:MAG: ABC transporter permease [Gammaproteobacteria bacterium]